MQSFGGEESGLLCYVQVIGTNSAENRFKQTNNRVHSYHVKAQWPKLVLAASVLSMNVKARSNLPASHPLCVSS